MSVSNKTQSLSAASASGLHNRFDMPGTILRSREFEKQVHEFELSLATHDTTSETPHTLFSPMHYEPGYAYPLIIWLHGKSNAAERQLMKIMPIISMRNYVATAPRGADCPASAKTGTAQYGWPNTETGFNLAQKRVFDCLHIASEKCNIARRRVFLAGFDDGGTMAFRVATQFPRYFAGVVSLGGSFPQGRMPLRQLDAVRQLPCLMCVGRDSPVFPPTEAARQMTLFHTAGMSVTVRQYPCRQEISTNMLEDLNRWIMEQVTR
ncbi:MAG: hypothetical protein FWH27_08405 [Planctomycetaceae bacterium]|nr:hypothetical protein [Planctomycetaceae bacterium]